MTICKASDEFKKHPCIANFNTKDKAKAEVAKRYAEFEDMAGGSDQVDALYDD